jgi:asparagine synthase (glutamine-hydrolysing)
MCGIAALVRTRGVMPATADLVRMTEVVRHRGPDGGDAICFDAELHATSREDWRVGLGHRRLSILDLSEAGRQPMSYRGRWWITYNGELYNYVEIAEELRKLGHEFRSGSDTEVLLGAFDEWGPACLERFRGMWGFALIDVRRRKLLLARDRLGIKPLYFARSGDCFAAASEIKQLRGLPGFRLTPDEAAVGQYLATGFEDARASFYSGVEQLPAGTYAELDLDTAKLAAPISYWHPERVRPHVTKRSEAAELMRSKLEESVRIHLRSDVPVGCALSGGLDSSAVCAFIRQVGGPSARIETFTAEFPGDPIDERTHADVVVNQIGAAPHYTEPTARSFLDDLDTFLWHHDEPVGSISQYAGYAVARLTRAAGVPVTLNGQGGDELLSGYWQTYFVLLAKLLRGGHVRTFGRELAGSLFPSGNAEVWRQLPRMWRRYRARRTTKRTDAPAFQFSRMPIAEWRVYMLRELTLPRLLKWDDRNFMAFSVEGRYPFLDHQVIEAGLSLAPETLFDRGWTKLPLRRAISGSLPDGIVWRKKKSGFETPQDRWIGSDLRGAIDSVLTGDSPVWSYADRGAARELSSHVNGLNGTGNESAQALVRLLFVDRWMRRCVDS